MEKNRLTFSTLGCPDLDLRSIAELACAHGYKYIEIRGIMENTEIDDLPIFKSENIEKTREILDEYGIGIISLDCSASFHGENSEKPINECRYAIEISKKLGIPYIRVFGNKIPDETAYSRIVSGIKEVCRAADGTGVKVMLEAHGDFNTAKVLRKLTDDVNSSSFGILWDIEHTYKAGQSAKEIVEALGDKIVHVHIKDLTNDVKLCLVGDGAINIGQVVNELESHGYRGLYSLEWEKRWHPELDCIEKALDHFENTLLKY